MTTEVESGSQVVDKPWRSLLKTLSWRATGTIDTMVISYVITGDVKVAGAIASIEVITKMVLYYLHERLWDRLRVGREVVAPPDYEI